MNQNAEVLNALWMTLVPECFDSDKQEDKGDDAIKKLCDCYVSGHTISLPSWHAGRDDGRADSLCPMPTSTAMTAMGMTSWQSAGR
jgi:hypothetical protein